MESSTNSRKLLMRGVFAIEKPKDVTSAQAIEKVKNVLFKELKARDRPFPLKVGHGGTLDSSATGVLVVGTCYGCKLLTKMLHGKKVYKFSGKLGVGTDTYDATGEVKQEAAYDHITREMFDEALQTFVGKISQIPPKFSALKKCGKRLSDLTRAGVEVTVAPRQVDCYTVKCLDFSPPHFEVEVSCGGGFYVRSLANDLGQKLGSCAHVTELRRSQHGPFTDVDAISIENLKVESIFEAIIEAQKKFGRLMKENETGASKHKDETMPRTSEQKNNASSQTNEQKNQASSQTSEEKDEAASQSGEIKDEEMPLTNEQNSEEKPQTNETVNEDIPQTSEIKDGQRSVMSEQNLQTD